MKRDIEDYKGVYEDPDGTGYVTIFVPDDEVTQILGHPYAYTREDNAALAVALIQAGASPWVAGAPMFEHNGGAGFIGPEILQKGR